MTRRPLKRSWRLAFIRVTVSSALTSHSTRRAKTHAREWRRWAAESNMSSEQNRSRYQQHRLNGAKAVAPSSIGAVCSIASQLRSSRGNQRRRIAVAPSVVVPSLGAQLRSASQSALIGLRIIVPCSHIAAQSQTSSSRPSAPGESVPLPNKRFVLTANRLAPVGPRAVGAAAAQPQRWTAKAEKRMKMVSELHQSRQGANQRCVADAAASVTALPGCHCAHRFASRAVPEAVQVNRLALGSVECLCSPRSFVLHRAAACSAIQHSSSLNAARTRSGSSRSAAKISRARRQSNNALVPTANRLAPVGSHRAYAVPAAQRRR
jgi:hypothetical protein